MTLWSVVEPLVLPFQIEVRRDKICKDGTVKPWNSIGNKLVSRDQLDDLVRVLVEQRNLPISRIAEELGVSVTTVRRVCRTLKIGRFVPEFNGIVSRSSQAPFGWDIVHGQLIRNQMEWDWVEKIQSFRKQGASLHKIANFLTEQQVATKNGGRWFAKTVSQILKFNDELLD